MWNLNGKLWYSEEEYKELEVYKDWCFTLMDTVEDIAKNQYPNTPYWTGIGSRLNINLAMLEQFEKDIAHYKASEKQYSWLIPVFTIMMIGVVFFAARLGEMSTKVEVQKNLCGILFTTVKEHDACIEDGLDSVYTKLMLKVDGNSYKYYNIDERL